MVLVKRCLSNDLHSHQHHLLMPLTLNFCVATRSMIGKVSFRSAQTTCISGWLDKWSNGTAGDRHTLLRPGKQCAAVEDRFSLVAGYQYRFLSPAQSSNSPS